MHDLVNVVCAVLIALFVVGPVLGSIGGRLLEYGLFLMIALHAGWGTAVRVRRGEEK
jgi:hypothetical protein